MSKINHRIFIGKTVSGKTFEAKKQMVESSKGALFINYVDTEKDSRFEQVDLNTDLELIKTLLRNGKKVQYNVKVDFDKEVWLLYKVAIEHLENIIICIDEIHLLNNKVKKIISNLWKTGRHKGIEAFGITQRPQELDRAMTTQSKYLYIFKCSMEDSYFQTYGIPKEKIPQVVHEHYRHEM